MSGETFCEHVKEDVYHDIGINLNTSLFEEMHTYGRLLNSTLAAFLPPPPPPPQENSRALSEEEQMVEDEEGESNKGNMR
eukprot:5424209-Ditylum_brightwellii.AAC.1